MSSRPPVQPPLSMTVSAEARAVLTPMLNPETRPEITPQMLLDPKILAAVRATMAQALKPIEAGRVKRFGLDVYEAVMGGVPVKRVIKRGTDLMPPDRLLINFHGGGFMAGAGSLTETLPIVGMTGVPGVTVDYRLAPEHAFPAAVDDALAVYRDALKRHAPSAIAIFGTSAGAILTMQLLARLKVEGLPMPAAAGMFSGGGDLSRIGDCEAYLPWLTGGRNLVEVLGHYCADTPRTDPLLSPNFGDLTGFPPIMLMASTRDQLLSQTVMTDLALRDAGIEVDLRIYEGMPHAFWTALECPETEIALRAQADFLKRHLSASVPEIRP